MTGFVSRYAQVVAATANHLIRVHKLFALVIVTSYAGNPKYEIYCQRSEVTCNCDDAHLIGEWERVWKLFFARAMRPASERHYYVAHRYV